MNEFAGNNNDRKHLCVLAAVTVLLSGAIVLMGYSNYREFRSSLINQTRDSLESICSLQIRHVSEWRTERLHDAQYIFSNIDRSIELKEFLADRDNRLKRERLLRWVVTYRDAFKYKKIALFDVSGEVILSTVGKESMHDAQIRKIRVAAEKKEIIVGDIDSLTPSGEVEISIYVPMIVFDGGQGHVVGVVALVMNPNWFLYKRLSRWPVDSQTAETNLVKLDGDDVLFLNEPRHMGKTAFPLRIPLTRDDVPAVRAVKGETGFSEGVDYRGVPVMAYYGPVPGTSWFIVAKSDTKEVMQPLERSLIYTILLTGVGILLVVSLLGIYWFRHKEKYYKRLAGAMDSVRKSDARLKFALEQSRTGGWDLDLVDHTAIRTPEHDRIFGYGELLPEWTYEIFLEHVLPEDRENVDRSFRQAVANRTVWSFECRIRRKDGDVRWIWAAGGHQLDSSGEPRRMAGVVQDITERKRTEEELAKYRDHLEGLVKERTAEIEQKNADLERMNRLFVDRELRMVELKERIRELEGKAIPEG